MYDAKLRFNQWYEPREDRIGIFENGTKIKFQMEHLQLDNMTSNTMPVILAPVKPLMNKKDIQLATVIGGGGSQSFSKLKSSVQEETKEESSTAAEKSVPFL